ncbi:hypothetical protein Nepgr_030509 [Nepenthes gracilis]|uniref:Pentatricopeptide repeat-containing protein n=1 Tax=Nepenthes gracilis TaxID=150966 RepID=A0AAD3Y6M3_NEPGR|nr:hypothetical protein Nepgr_030509 [Nepenthes gracilis]
MKRYHIQPNLVTYNTLLRARKRYGSLQEVQQCLAIYQDMRRAGYKPNDYYLKQLIEEWCEGVMVKNYQKADQSSFGDRADFQGPESVLLERVALHLQKSTTESLAVDIQGLTKVEARIVVLAVLRMIKENHASGDQIKDDLIIVLGVQKVGADTIVRDAIRNLLRDEFRLEVISAKPSIGFGRKLDSGSPRCSDSNSKIIPSTSKPTAETDCAARRPAMPQRLIVTRKSLCRWLQRRRLATAIRGK